MTLSITSILLTIIGLCLFETISSIDNAIINAEVLGKMPRWAQRWFLVWGILIAVFVIRGVLPWFIVWVTTPGLGFLESFTATFDANNVAAAEAIEKSAPVLLMGGGIFFVFLFLHWLFIEKKEFGLSHEKFFAKFGGWFFATVSIILTAVVWFGMKIDNMIAFGAVVGSTAFFITHGFKQYAEEQESKLLSGASSMSAIGKLLYLEVIDATFSIDGVVGAFAFTLAVPLILLGNGLGALVVRQLTVGNIERIKKYKFLKNGAMYSIFILGLIMLSDGFGYHLPEWLSPVSTFAIVGYFFWKSKKALQVKI